MRSTTTTAPRGRRSLRYPVAALSLPLALLFAGCTPPASTEEPETAASSAGQADLGSCGTVPEKPVEDPDGAVAALPQEVQAAYNGYPLPVYKSPFEDLDPSEGPFKVGLSYLPPVNPFGASVVEQLRKSFDEAKAEGLVEGELVERILPDPATMTPAEQVRGYEELVREGVDIILTSPLSGDAMAEPVTRAGEERGVITVSLSAVIPSKYAINVADNAYLNMALPTAEVVQQMGGKGNVVMVRGVPGIPTDQYGADAANAVLENCPDITVSGEVVGNFVPASTKSAMLQYLASHPEQIDGVFQVGTMGSGVFAAFEQTGRPFPKVVDAGAQAASLAYWDKAQQEGGYETAGTGGNGTQQAKAMFDVALRTAQGEGPLVNNITRTPSLITNENLDEYLPEGADTSSPGEVLDGEPWMPKEYLDQFFKNPSA